MICMEFILSLLLILLELLGVYSNTAPQDPRVATYVTAEVEKVVDGDTIVVRLDGREETIRYIGIDTPEPYRDGDPACYSLEASLRNKELVQGKTVRLEADIEERDRYDRLLRYVYMDDVFVNEVLIQEGYAEDLPIKPNTKYASRFADLERQAREGERGVWGTCK